MPSEPVVKESWTTAELVAWLREQAEARMVNTFSTLDQQEAESLDDAAKYATAANLIEQSAINNLRSRIYGLMDGFTSSSGPALEVELETVKAERDGLSGQVVDMQSKVQILLNKGLDISLRCLQNEISDNTAANEFIECFDGADQRRLSATLELPAAVAKVQEWREASALLHELMPDGFRIMSTGQQLFTGEERDGVTVCFFLPGNMSLSEPTDRILAHYRKTKASKEAPDEPTI